MSCTVRFPALLVGLLGLTMQACVTFDDAPYEVTTDPSGQLSPDVPSKPAPSVPATPLPDAEPLCPTFCQTGCEGDECVIDCTTQECQGALFVCPEGINCSLFCGDKTAACKQSTLRCELGNDCAASCTTKGACEELLVVCSSGSCELACEVEGSCKGGTLECSPQADCSVDTCGDKDLPKCDEPQDCLQEVACPSGEEEDD